MSIDMSIDNATNKVSDTANIEPDTAHAEANIADTELSTSNDMIGADISTAHTAGGDSSLTSAACPHCCDGCRHKERTDKEYRDLIARLNRIEGQIRGIKGMVDNSSYCIDILTQVSAATSALNSFSKVLLSNHIKSCVANDIRDGNEEKLNELVQFLPKMMK